MRVTKEQVLAAITKRLKHDTKTWQLISIYNELAECNVLEINDLGEITCDQDDPNIDLTGELK